MKRAAVAVIGGGVMGASVAYHLASAGQRDVLVLDRGNHPGTGSTGRATGGFRAQYGTAINVRLSLLARAKLVAFRDETGVDPGYVRAGYLWLAVSQAELDALDAGRQVQHAEGLHEAARVTAEDIGRINPAIRLDGIVGGAFCPSDGFIRPLQILEGYLAAAARLGVRVVWGVAVTGFRRGRGDRIEAVETTDGPVAVEAVVNAAGPWAGAVADLAGAPIPLTPLRRQIVPTTACDLLPPDMPMTIWAGDGFHLRVRDGRVLLLWPTPGEPGRPFDTSVDPAWIEAVRKMAHDRVPALRSVALDPAAAWAGLYEMSPDKHAILGAAPACPNLYYVNGSSGHGVMHSPALGQLLAEIICNGHASTLDVGCLAPDRFERRALLTVSEVL
jgi:sarcosine oxidase, subunit beta